MSYPTISIVTACFNHEQFIAETIESIISQNYPNLQYVVIDDNSSDKSWKIIQKYKKYLYHCEKLEGKRNTPCYALNYAFSKVNGEVMGWLNSDDILLQKSLFTVANIFNDNKEVDWFTGVSTAINERSEIISSRVCFKNLYDFLTDDWIVIQQESTFFRKNLWKKAGGKLIENKWAFDTELWTRFFPLAEHYHVAAAIGAFRKNSKSQSVADNKTFMKHNMEHLEKLKNNCSLRLKNEAFIYKRLKTLSIISSTLNNKALKQIPSSRKFLYKKILYSSNNSKWIIKEINPFNIHRSKHNYL